MLSVSKKKVVTIFTIVLSCVIAATAQSHKLEKLWETDAVVAVPESVLPYDGGKKLYVSLIDGGGWDADGKGGVAKLDPDSTNLNQAWITGLNAPKGMGLVGKRLYVADIKEVVVINTKDSKVEKKIAIEGATGLNDITVDSKGIVYVSDSRNAKIWRIENDLPTLFLDNVKGVNGLKAIGSDLFIGAGKTFEKTNSQKKVTVIAEMPQGIDGIEPAGNGDFILTGWSGYIFYVFADGRIEQLLDTHLDKKNSADIGFDPRRKILFVPTFNGKTVAAYRLSNLQTVPNSKAEQTAATKP
jgi:sugar lactone lactonase YvrE